jgi:hypothetical protein
MSDFECVDSTRLSMLLATQRANYIKLLKCGSLEEFRLCRAWIILLRKEIDLRKTANDKVK